MKVTLSETITQLKVFTRNPLSAFFTVAFPMMFLIIFNLLNSGATVDSAGGVSFSQFFTPAIAVFAMVTSVYTSMAITTAIDRDEGVLKRIRGTPIPAASFLTARVVAAVLVGVASVITMFVVGVLLFDVEVLWGRIPLAMLVLIVGSSAFAALGLAVASIAPNGQSAPAIANATILPLAFFSGIFFPASAAPEWVQTLADLLPLKPFVDAFSRQWNPALAAGVSWFDLATLIAWALIGVAICVRYFSWDPKPGGGRRSQAKAHQAS